MDGVRLHAHKWMLGLQHAAAKHDGRRWAQQVLGTARQGGKKGLPTQVSGKQRAQHAAQRCNQVQQAEAPAAGGRREQVCDQGLGVGQYLQYRRAGERRARHAAAAAALASAVALAHESVARLPGTDQSQAEAVQPPHGEAHCERVAGGKGARGQRPDDALCPDNAAAVQHVACAQSRSSGSVKSLALGCRQALRRHARAPATPLRGEHSACMAARASVMVPSCVGLASKLAAIQLYTDASSCSSARSSTAARLTISTVAALPSVQAFSPMSPAGSVDFKCDDDDDVHASWRGGCHQAALR
jgi:hypothetical protein